MTEQNYAKIIAKNLRDIMAQHDITQSELSEILGINKSTLSSWMNGTRIMRMDKIDLLCHFFNCSRSDLMEPNGADQLSRREKFTSLLGQMTEEEQKSIIKYMEFLISKH